MPFSTKLFSKKNKRQIALSLFILVFVLIFPFFLDLEKNSPVTSNTKAPESSLKSILQRAKHYSSTASDSAELLARKSLNISVNQNDKTSEIQSLLILGHIKKLKSEHSKALGFYSRATKLARQTGNINALCEAIVNEGEIVYKRGDYNKSLYYFKKVDSLAKVYSLEEQQAYAEYYLGKAYQTKGNFDKANFYYHSSLALARKNKDKKQLALLLPSLGKHYISEGKLNKALSSYQEAFRISTELNDLLLSADICNHLGSLYLDLKEFDKAIIYHRQALSYRLTLNYPGELAKSYNNLGKIHLATNQLDSAEFYFHKSYLLCVNIDYKKGLVKSLTNLGDVYRSANQYNKAFECLNESFKIATSIGYDIGVAEASLGLAEVLFKENKMDSAIFYYNVSLSKFEKTNYNEDLLRVYKGLYTCYFNKKEYKKALTYHISVLETEKKSLDVENKRQLAIVNISFDTERKEQDYKVLLKDNALKASLIKSKNTFIWLIVAVLGFTILLCLHVYNRFYLKKKANAKLEELNRTITNRNIEFKKLNKELEMANKEKDKLFSIISHELRNPLYWLQNLAEVLSRKHTTMSEEKVKKTLISMDESAKNVYHLMDNLLHWSRNKLNRVHPKKSRHNLFTLVTDTTRMYETFLQQKEISFSIDIPKDIFIHADGDLFACVIRNLISNAIKYTPNGGKISFKQEISTYHVTVVLIDSGKGMSDRQLKSIFDFEDTNISMPGLMQEKGSGLGLKLCKDFVEMNDGKFWADSIAGIGTRFFFTVPLQSPVRIKLEELEIAENLN
ncbi:hypothetical protein CNR22_01455 [Sphingobacteriaceae bacterium]|nr:hypothetical protein CNR22_01455 [Sphingobacteriaceae bacterium]